MGSCIPLTVYAQLINSYLCDSPSSMPLADLSPAVGYAAIAGLASLLPVHLIESNTSKYNHWSVAGPKKLISQIEQPELDKMGSMNSGRYATLGEEESDKEADKEEDPLQQTDALSEDGNEAQAPVGNKKRAQTDKQQQPSKKSKR
ncbi:hypothetical protein PROFUN_16244 [Planoprotostelium fungivorum]|uniref:Uncharacterized protein n=1 Tax=Planoprotostelium fungivorum TaxID=1890364 RepID=A0A2P6MR98_9EUKA|nr:hypothetical protein PROFUN_16244 [Planoprotostelium fungivorum]